MTTPFVGEIKMFAGNFAPQGYALCDGQLLAISQNDALFSLFGTIYGGDGRTTFALPDLRGRLAMHEGQGPGLSDRRIGQKSGAETATVSASQTAAHRHTMSASSQNGDSGVAVGNVLAKSGSQSSYKVGATNVAMSVSTGASAGGTQSHDNIMPFQCINYIVALFGVYPSRS